MSLQKLLTEKPYVLGKGKSNKYHPTKLDGHRVLANGSIVVRTVSVKGKPVEDDYDAKHIKDYKKAVKASARA